MLSGPTLLRRFGRRFSRRFVFLGALTAILLAAPSASGAAAALDLDVTVVGTPGLNGWYRGDVTVSWTKSGEEGSEGCDTQTLRLDTAGTKITCWVWIGPKTDPTEEIKKSITVRLDKTPPAVTASPERPADANGWYNKPVTLAFTATDATSGPAGCSAAVRYAGPDNPSAVVAGSCTDIAGNPASASHGFRYDATAPTLFSVAARHGNRAAEIAWRKSSDTRVVEVFRAPGRNGQGESGVYRGAATGFRDKGLIVGRNYEYRVIAVDDALNRVQRTLELIATGPLLSPAPAARLRGPPALAWTSVKRASYYNVQLIRNGRKILSAWPVRPSYRLRRTWSYQGRRFRLRPGTYRWYVWPGFGPLAAGRYGNEPLGSSTFVVTK